MKNSLFKILLSFIICQSSITTLKSQTDISSGDVYGKWTYSGTPYRINGDIRIPNDSTLTIEPGVVVEFQDHYRIDVSGSIVAVGNSTDTIVFTVNDTSGYHNNSHTGWLGIRFKNIVSSNDSSKLEFCRFEYGKATNDTLFGDSELDHGGAIYLINFSKLKIKHCSFLHNYAEMNGGAICVFYPSATQEKISIDSCFFFDNSEGVSGFSSSGAAICCNANLDVYNSVFLNNRTHGRGGAVCTGDMGNSRIVNSIFINNYARLSGGALYLDGNNTLVNVLVVKDTSLENKGGGIYIESQANVHIINSTIAQNNSGEEGGGIANNGKLTLTNTLITENTDGTTGEYGNIYNENNLVSKGYNMVNNIGDEEFILAKGDRIGTKTSPVDPYLKTDFTLTDSSYCVNRGSSDTTGLLLPAFDLLGNPRIYKGTVSRVDIGAYEFQGNPVPKKEITAFPDSVALGYTTTGTSSNDSIVLFNTGTSDLTISGITTSNDFDIKLQGDAAYGHSIAGFVLPAYKDTVINLRFSAVSEQKIADTIKILSDATNKPELLVMVSAAGTDLPIISGDIYTDTTWCLDSVAITSDITVKDSATLTICAGSYIEFMGHYALTIEGTLKATGSESDTIWFTAGDTLTGWKGIRFDNSYNGANGAMDDNDTSVIKYCKISYGKADNGNMSYETADYGGGIYINRFNRLVIEYSTITHNTAFDEGGGIYMEEADVVVRNCNIQNNKAKNGGGLSTNNSNSTFENNVFWKNKSSSSGGGIYSAYSTPKFINNKICNNLSGKGGGIYFIGNVNMFNNLVSNNQAINGGGIYSDFSNSKLVNNTVVNNYAVLTGGGIYLNYHSSGYTDTIVNCIIYGNESGVTDSSIYGNEMVSYSDVQNGFPGTNNIDADPMFVEPSAGTGAGFEGLYVTWYLAKGSPCINAGTPDTTGLSLPLYDLKFENRINCIEDTVDMGAYEFYDMEFLPVVHGEEISINENLGAGTIIDTIQTEHVQYITILNGNTGQAFQIDSITGIVKVYNMAALNYETQPCFEMIVRGYQGCLYKENLLVIHLLDVNEPPVIVPATFSIVEHSNKGVTVGMVEAVDPDAGQTISYSITGGNTGNAFSIGSADGVIRVADSSAIDYKTHPEFKLIVKAVDDGNGNLYDTALVTVRLTKNPGSAVDNLSKIPLQVYPNPAYDKLTVILPPQPGNVDVEIINTIGKSIYSKHIESPEFNSRVQIDVSELPSGLYFLKIGNDEYAESKKIFLLK